jgi:uncharacterized membrane protein YfcA
MLGDPMFYVTGVPAVLLYGIAKGGFGGAIALLSVPLMSLVMPPAQAAAILLPILVVMDALVVRTYWGQFDATALRYLIPGAMLGIVLGYAMADNLSDGVMRILIGSIAVIFGLQQLLRLAAHIGRRHHAGAAGLFGALAGFTSFAIHAGGPPLTMYLLPKRLPPLVFAGTAGLFFAAVNLAKLLPYYWLDQFDGTNLRYSLALVLLAPVGVWIGHQLVRRTDPALYYRLIAAFLVAVGLKLLYDGIGGIGDDAGHAAEESGREARAPVAGGYTADDFAVIDMGETT